MVMPLETFITGVIQQWLNLLPCTRGVLCCYIILGEIITTMKTSLQVFNSSKPLFEALAKKLPMKVSCYILYSGSMLTLFNTKNMLFLSMMLCGPF